MRILIIEDEFNLADVIAARLRQEHYEAEICQDGDEGLYLASAGIYDLILLDVMLPGKDGFEILRELRQQGMRSKIIMLTARSMLEDKLEGLEHGANDYITKPFHMDELMARVHIQMSSPESCQEQNQLTYGDLSLDTSNLKLTSRTA
ncbi:MAG: response regulator [Firmicutes bacterium]|uniref:response regulator transcription factor n=1 Tax=Lentihominibacter sp. TaxID=2944216 RepID=UPI002A4EE9C7|nr:response regulator [Lentihominibacter sp.]MDD7319645.1 response regulator [Bacillota bacterium]MDY5286998.1 response regulator [Lentihominibacter sp.]